LKQIGHEAIDELASLVSLAEEKSKIALMDLFRLLVSVGDQAEYIITSHWSLI
jgi:hypothetical protein